MNNLARNERIKELRSDGVGPREIARRLNLSPHVVAGVLRRAGMCVEKRGRGHGAPPEFRALVIADADRETQARAAAKWGVHPATVSRWSQGRAA